MPSLEFHPLDSTRRKPSRFTFPFCYEPHPLCRLAARRVQDYVASVPAMDAELMKGKMLGVLIVENADGQTGFLAAYSGQVESLSRCTYFVPPVFDTIVPSGHFKTGEARITAINREIEGIEESSVYLAAQQEAARAKSEAAMEEDSYRELMRQAKARRDARRKNGAALTAADEEQMIHESQHMKAELRRIRQRNALRIEEAGSRIAAFDGRVSELKAQRRQMSDSLQQWLFGQYRMLNARGESRPLTEIFASTPSKTPPAGAGDCCAPKLLQYAYAHNMRPVCMAEFWYGESPKREVRHHLHYYPACRGKCLPILTWMMQGLDVDPDPCLNGCTQPLEIVWEDDTLTVVNKPAGMLSVPGRDGRESVQSLLTERASGSCEIYMVHRLDMDTSGLMVAAKNAQACLDMQRQFARRTVSKCYTAVLDGSVSDREEGDIALPLYADPLDRPYQKVDFSLGKTSLTSYRVIKSTPSATLAELVPHTGRTHQLRVHCASPLGLNAPIRGDRLYGHPADRLYLHATRLSFRHPVTGEVLTFRREAPFSL